MMRVNTALMPYGTNAVRLLGGARQSSPDNYTPDNIDGER